MSDPTRPDVRPVDASEQSEWMRLFAQYREFRGFTADDEIVNTVWGWVLEHRHGFVSLVVPNEAGGLVGFANVRPYPLPANARLGLFLDDLFTDPSARGRGVAGALLEGAARFAHEHDALFVRWVTTSGNSTARSVYDAHANAKPLITYEMTVSRSGDLDVLPTTNVR